MAIENPFWAQYETTTPQTSENIPTAEQIASGEVRYKSPLQGLFIAVTDEMLSGRIPFGDYPNVDAFLRTALD
jgi:hypothetical protein